MFWYFACFYLNIVEFDSTKIKNVWLKIFIQIKFENNILRSLLFQVHILFTVDFMFASFEFYNEYAS